MAVASAAEARTSLRTSLSGPDDAISRRLVDARLKAEPLADFPGRLPTTLEQAYAIQSASVDRWPDEAAPDGIVGDPLQALRFLIRLSASRGIEFGHTVNRTGRQSD